ncbi:hypothetical protein KM043_012761 [Ampulex compressa]|nr:hypothetical protein KM043_012761 [Ampulex compressa]
MRTAQKLEMWLNKLAVCGLILVLAKADQEVQLEIPQGQLKGTKTDTVFHNKPYYSFKGIPYVKPNVGPNRFSSPEPAESWNGVYDATYNRPPCPFHCMMQNANIGEEDCLYLNIYTPTLDKDARKAVMVWIHPGGWNGGFGDDRLYAPDYLVEEDVVIVTMNYRLGAIGYLNTDDKNAYGNVGMKDQVMALKWVKDNIHYFGGCPDRVTIFGQCSGGASVQYHMVSPMSEGLFSGAIIQSGSVLNPWSVADNIKGLSFMLGEALGIQTTDSGELLQKLAERKAEDLVTATGEIMMTMNSLNGKMFAFAPSIEPNLGQDAFLTENPWATLTSGRLADVPVMIGGVVDEAFVYANMLLDSIGELKDHPEKFVPLDLNITDSSEMKQVGESLRNFYFGDKPTTVDSIEEYAMLLSDLYFDAGLRISADIMSKRNSAPIYEYLFSYESPSGLMKTLTNVQGGVAHGDELGHIFYMKLMDNLPEPGSAAEKVTRIMTKLWTNFAKHRNPTAEKDELVNVDWLPKGEENNYIEIGEELKTMKNFRPERMDFWRDLYKDAMGNYA